MTENVRLDASYRIASIQAMREHTLDILIIGGGITGVGAALDAAARGLKVGLIEQYDIASGTSSKSSKMIHGGLRYLEQLDFSLVKEALKERKLLLTKIAPHLVTPVPFLYPLRFRLWERAYVGSGILIYDWLAKDRHLPSSRHLSKQQTASLAPALNPESYIGGIQFWDAQEDDARFALCVARTAANYGGLIATRIKCLELLHRDGCVIGAEVSDLSTGESFSIHARHVITATGAWTGKLQQGLVSLPFQVRPSIGAHIILPANAINMNTGLLARTPTGLLFVIPWEGQWLVGDTDSEWTGSPEDITVSSTEIQQLLLRLNHVLKNPVSANQIVGIFVGLRPLVSSSSHADTRKLSRHHVIATPLPGLTMIAGGKYTTYRIMAADVVDEVLRSIPKGDIFVSSTENIPLIGAHRYKELQQKISDLALSSGLTTEKIERLLKRYGDKVTELLDMIFSSPELANIIRNSNGVLKVEIAYACTHEGAVSLEDIMERRTRMSVLLPKQGDDVIDEVNSIVQQYLKWSDETARKEIADYRHKFIYS